MRTPPSSRAELLPLVGDRASVEIAAFVIPPVLIASVPSGAPNGAVWCWAGAFWLASLLVVFVRRRFRRDLKALTPSDFEALWGRRFETAALAFGLVWGMATWAAASVGSFEYAVLVYLVLAGVTVSTAAFAAADLRIFARFLLPTWLLAIFAVPWAFPSHWLAVLPLTVLFPWLVWMHARTSHGFLVQQSQLKRDSEVLARAHAEARDAAAAASREKSRFLAMASHDLRQPLYALTLTAQAALQRNRDAALTPLLVDISQAASHVNDLLNALLDLSALDSKGSAAAPQPMPLAPLLNDLHDRFRPEAAARALRWRLRLPGQPAWVMADPVLLRRALANLLHNALRYTPRGGVLLSVRQRGGAWAIEVWDTGVGIAEAQRQRLFSEFERSDQAAAMERDGHGLGLSVVRDCAQRMDASVEWRSVHGKGSCFRLLLHPAQAPAAQAQAMVEVPGFPPLAGRVLVVDDDDGVLRGLQHLLHAWGVVCRVAADGQQAEAVLAEGFEPDVVICDLRLRGSERGYAVLQALLARQAQARGLVVTGELDHPDLMQADDDGHLVLRKPVQPGPLHTVLASLLTASPPPRG